MTTPIKLGIAEDHELLREGLTSILGSEPEFELVFSVSNGKEVFEKLENCQLEILLLDLDMPIMNGVEVMRKLRVEYPHVKSVILSMHYSREFILECLTIGAAGFLAKNTNVENIMEALQCYISLVFMFVETTQWTLL